MKLHVSGPEADAMIIAVENKGGVLKSKVEWSLPQRDLLVKASTHSPHTEGLWVFC